MGSAAKRGLLPSLVKVSLQEIIPIVISGLIIGFSCKMARSATKVRL